MRASSRIYGVVFVLGWMACNAPARGACPPQTSLDCDPNYCTERFNYGGTYDNNTGTLCRKWVTVIENTWDCPRTLDDGSTEAGPGRFKVQKEGYKMEVIEYGTCWCEDVSTNPYAECDDAIETCDCVASTYCDLQWEMWGTKEFVDCVDEG